MSTFVCVPDKQTSLNVGVLNIQREWNMVKGDTKKKINKISSIESTPKPFSSFKRILKKKKTYYETNIWHLNNLTAVQVNHDILIWHF